MISFGDRLQNAFTDFGHLCVGIDPHEWILEQWGLPNSPAGAQEFALRILDLSSECVGLYKVQVAFYERFGSKGIFALEEVISAIRSTGALVIADGKRGDISSTMSGYAKAWLCRDSRLFSDALTVSPYVGLGSFKGSIDIARQNGAGLFFLAATSEMHAFPIQSAILQDRQGTFGESSGSILSCSDITVASYIFESIGTLVGNSSDCSSFGVVLSATSDLLSLGIGCNLSEFSRVMPILAPGFGYQGVELKDSRKRFGSLISNLIISESRSLLASGPRRFSALVNTRSEELRSLFDDSHENAG